MRTQTIATQPRAKKLPPDLMQLLAGGGINQSVPSINLPVNQCLTCMNLRPTSAGLTNENMGVHKLNTDTPINSKVQFLSAFNNVLIFIAGGNIYEMPLTGGATTQITAGVFHNKNNVQGVIAQGDGEQKLYLMGLWVDIFYYIKQPLVLLCIYLLLTH